MYINDIRLVGQLVEDVSITHGRNNSPVITATVMTARPVKDSLTGNTKWLSQKHKVRCFRKELVGVMEKHGKKGRFVKILGEVVYGDNGQAEILVRSGSGEFGMMNSVVAHQEASSVPGTSAKSTPASSKNSGDREFRDDAQAGGSAAAKSEPSWESDKGSRSNRYSDYDDEIPF